MALKFGTVCFDVLSGTDAVPAHADEDVYGANEDNADPMAISDGNSVRDKRAVHRKRKRTVGTENSLTGRTFYIYPLPLLYILYRGK